MSNISVRQVGADPFLRAGGRSAGSGQGVPSAEPKQTVHPQPGPALGQNGGHRADRLPQLPPSPAGAGAVRRSAGGGAQMSRTARHRGLGGGHLLSELRRQHRVPRRRCRHAAGKDPSGDG